MDERQIAEELTKFLLLPGRGNYGIPNVSPLQRYVETEIKAICEYVAKEVVDAHSGLREVIRERCQKAIRDALANDPHLNRLVSEAVAKQLTTVALESSEDE